MVAGEASGDLLAAATLRALGEDWGAFGVGGPASVAAGLEPLERAEALGLMGLVEVFSGLPRIARVAARLLAEVARRRPDAVLLVDMPDFNLRFGPLVRRVLGASAPIIYLGAPQAWAWRAGRARAMARWVDLLACLFPFEPAFFRSHGVRAEFVGHPRAVEAAQLAPPAQRDRIAILPGSRRSELGRHLPVLAQALPGLAALTPTHHRVLVVAPTLEVDEVARGLGEAALRHVELVREDALEVLRRAELVWTASGTAVTECVVCGAVPVVFYRVHPATYAVARRLVRTEHIAMANLLAGRRLVPELVQDAFTARSLLEATRRLWLDAQGRAEVRAVLSGLAAELAGPSDDGADPGQRVARAITARVRP